MRTGDLCASGTLSGPTRDSWGSLLELSVNGAEPLALGQSGEKRGFIQDGDELTIRGWAVGGGASKKIGFGAASGTILPA